MDKRTTIDEILQYWAENVERKVRSVELPDSQEVIRLASIRAANSSVSVKETANIWLAIEEKIQARKHRLTLTPD